MWSGCGGLARFAQDLFKVLFKDVIFAVTLVFEAVEFFGGGFFFEPSDVDDAHVCGEDQISKQ